MSWVCLPSKILTFLKATMVKNINTAKKKILAYKRVIEKLKDILSVINSESSISFIEIVVAV